MEKAKVSHADEGVTRCDSQSVLSLASYQVVHRGMFGSLR